MSGERLKEVAQNVSHLSFGFVFAMPEGLIVDLWALPKQEAGLNILAKALLELSLWARTSSALLGKKPPLLLLEGGMSLCGCEIDARRFLVLGFEAEAALGWVRRSTLRVVEEMREAQPSP